jgi:hypothetical protein
MEITLPLSNDERTILMIACAGESMIPIGRWERPVKSLAAKGYLKMIDHVNYVITAAGRRASEAAEREVDARLRQVRNA